MSRSVDVFAGVALVSFLLLGEAAQAQIVQGRVLDSTNDEPVATARVTLYTADGRAVATTLADAQGRFTIQAEGPGPHLLEGDRLGYRHQRTDTFHVLPDGRTAQDVRLTSRAVEVEGIVVEGYPGQLLHSRELAGVYARRARSPSVGNNRVLVRGDPDLDSQLRVRDVLPPLIPRSLCPHRNSRGEPIPFLYFDGWEANVLGYEATDWVLDLAIREIQAVEFYRDLTSAPLWLRPVQAGRMERPDRIYRDPVRMCGLVAVWSVGAR